MDEDLDAEELRHRADRPSKIKPFNPPESAALLAEDIITMGELLKGGFALEGSLIPKMTWSVIDLLDLLIKSLNTPGVIQFFEKTVSVTVKEKFPEELHTSTDKRLYPISVKRDPKKLSKEARLRIYTSDPTTVRFEGEPVQERDDFFIHNPGALGGNWKQKLRKPLKDIDGNIIQYMPKDAPLMPSRAYIHTGASVSSSKKITPGTKDTHVDDAFKEACSRFELWIRWVMEGLLNFTHNPYSFNPLYGKKGDDETKKSATRTEQFVFKRNKARNKKKSANNTKK
jgi:hypothetical protein